MTQNNTTISLCCAKCLEVNNTCKVTGRLFCPSLSKWANHIPPPSVELVDRSDGRWSYTVKPAGGAVPCLGFVIKAEKGHTCIHCYWTMCVCSCRIGTRDVSTARFARWLWTWRTTKATTRSPIATRESHTAPAPPPCGELAVYSLQAHH